MALPYVWCKLCTVDFAPVNFNALYTSLKRLRFSFRFSLFISSLSFRFGQTIKKTWPTTITSLCLALVMGLAPPALDSVKNDLSGSFLPSVAWALKSKWSAQDQTVLRMPGLLQALDAIKASVANVAVKRPDGRQVAEQQQQRQEAVGKQLLDVRRPESGKPYATLTDVQIENGDRCHKCSGQAAVIVGGTRRLDELLLNATRTKPLPAPEYQAPTA